MEGGAGIVATQRIQRGGWNFVRGQVCGENFVLVWCRNFPGEFFAQFLGGLPSAWRAPIVRWTQGGGGHFFRCISRRYALQNTKSFQLCCALCHPGPCSFFLISDELVLFKIWACQSFTRLIVHKEPKGWGCRSFPRLTALHQNWRCVKISPAETVPRRNPPPPPL